MVSLSCLYNRCEGVTILILLSILDELVLLDEVLKSPFFASHFIFQYLDFCLKLDVLFLVSVSSLFELEDLFLELLWHLMIRAEVVTIDTMGRLSNCRLVLTTHMSTITGHS